MEKKEFHYTYSAPTEAQRREITDIRRQYEPSVKKPESDLARLRRLDAYVTGSATAVGLILGILGTLVFGLGLAMVLEWELLFFGVAVALLGAVPMLAAYPVFRLVLKRNRQKYGPEILRLSEELLREDSET